MANPRLMFYLSFEGNSSIESARMRGSFASRRESAVNYLCKFEV
jgi:hypothetical protein